MNNWFFQIISEASPFNVFSVLLCVFSLVGGFYFRRAFLRLSKKLYNLENEFRAMNRGHLGMGREISKVSREIANVESVQEQKEHQGTDEKVYQQAGLLLARGATISEVVESCEIAPAEAELLAIMQNSAPTHHPDSVSHSAQAMGQSKVA